MTSELVASARFRFGRTRGEMADVPVELAQGLEGSRGRYEFRVAAPDTTAEGSTLRLLGPETPRQTSMWCLELTVDCRTTGARSDLDPQAAVGVAEQIATDVWTALILILPKLGFPGAPVYADSCSATIDGEPVGVSSGRHRDKNSVIVVPERVISVDEILHAAQGTQTISRARMMVAEAGHQALFNPNASQVTAVVVAASACEIATHQCIRRLSSGPIKGLMAAILPTGQQAKLSPAKLIDTVLPVLVGKRLSDEDSDLWGALQRLFTARDVAVHQGELPQGPSASFLVSKARHFIEWMESLEG